MERQLKYDISQTDLEDILKIDEQKIRDFQTGFDNYVLEVNPMLEDDPKTSVMLLDYINIVYETIDQEMLLYIGAAFPVIVVHAMNTAFKKMRENDREMVAKRIVFGSRDIEN